MEVVLILFFAVHQELGPYAVWQHHHTYTAAVGEGGGTICSDVVRCAAFGCS